MKTKTNKLIDILLIVIFFFLGFKVKNTNTGIFFDYTILDFLHRKTSIFLLKASSLISTMGSAKVIIPLVIILSIYLIKKKRFDDLFILLANSLLSTIINYLLKLYFNRIRPLAYFRTDYSGLSFPSGHSMTNMSLVLALLYIFNKDKNKVVNLIGYLYIVCVGLSRLYLGVHWPTDVIGGFIIGYVIFDLSKTYINNKKMSLTKKL